MTADERALVTRSELRKGLRDLGVRRGTVLMVHASLSRLGWVVGGSGTVVLALLDAVGPEGTVACVAGWEDNPYHLESWPAEKQRVYVEELPAFDAASSEAAHSMGRLAERIRTWPGAQSSSHPDARVAAVGARAAWLVARHPLDDAFGPESPFGRFVEAGGQVLMLGAPLDVLSVLHYAEHSAAVPGKRTRTYRAPLLVDGKKRWTSITDMDTDPGPFPYEDVFGVKADSAFEPIARYALESGIGTRGRIGESPCHLFDVGPLVEFAVGWMETNFGSARAHG